MTTTAQKGSPPLRSSLHAPTGPRRGRNAPYPLLLLLEHGHAFPAPLLWRLLQERLPGWRPAKLIALRTLLTYPPLKERTSKAAEQYEQRSAQATAVEECAEWLASRLEHLHQAWRRHPQGKDTQTALAETPVLVAFTHRPGREGRAVSFYQSSFSEALSPKSWEWQKSRIVGDEENGGRYAGVIPVASGIRVDPYRQGYINNSAATEGSRGFFARERLKGLLPPRSAKWVGKARSWNRRTKGAMIAEITGEPWQLARSDSGRAMQSEMVHRKSKERRRTPAWYRQDTKGVLWMKKILPEPVRVAAAEVLYEHSAFWDIATGKVHPADLEDYIRSPDERKGRARRLREDRHAWKRHERETAGGQQRLKL